MLRYTHIFIDLDDTLWDFRTNSRQALKQCWDAFDLRRYYPDFEAMHAWYASRNRELWQLYHHGRIAREQLMHERFNGLLERVGVRDEHRVAAMNRFYLDTLAEQQLLLPYARELLEYLKPRYPLSILSNGFAEVQFRKLEASRISGYFQHVILSEEAGATKPDPAIFRYALNKAGITAREALFIGDNFDADIEGAFRSSIDQIYFNPDHAPLPEGVSFQPTYETDSLLQITKWL